MATDINQHNEEIQENLRHWERKPGLQIEYRRFYREIAARLTNLPEGPVLECGSGIGNLKSVLPNAITSDLFPNPWLDRRENIYALSYAESAVAAVVLFDVFHHLEYPGTALCEVRRVLRPGGRLVIFEPAVGVLGRVALRLFHHEPLAIGQPIRWEAPEGFKAESARYYAAQGNAWRIFRRKQLGELIAGLSLMEIVYFPALPWLLTGGFRGPNLCPAALRPIATATDHLLSFAPHFFASRMLIVLAKTTSS